MDLLDQVNSFCFDPAFQERIVRFLDHICSIDTTPCADLAVLVEREDQVFNSIIDQLNQLAFPKTRVLKKQISPQIEKHPAYSRPFYTESAENPSGLSAEEVYRDRYNLLYSIEQAASGSGHNTAVNAHIDTVVPFFPPRRQQDYLYGRGTADDKGNVAVLIGALMVLDHLSALKAVTLKNTITAMFVIDEEIGGNGSLDLALDRELVADFASILILECTENKVHPANRGAVYFKGELNKKQDADLSQQDFSLLEATLWAVLEMEKEGDRIREESSHPLFPHRPVQTCFGILGPFGKHPSSICGRVGLVVEGLDKDLDLLRTFLEKGLARYIAKYGDKTTEIDPSTGKKKVEIHFETEIQDAGAFTVVVHGSTGHMGSLPQNDAAITKAAYLAEELLQAKLSGVLSLKIDLLGAPSGDYSLLEGAQGFLPTHAIGQIEQRMTAAFRRGVESYCNIAGWRPNDLQYSIDFKKLHNDAFACDPDSASMRNARKAGLMAATVKEADPWIGWDVSCDARLFANAYPQMPVITAGAGRLQDAHSDEERIYIPDLFKSIVFTALFLLLETGSIDYQVL